MIPAQAILGLIGAFAFFLFWITAFIILYHLTRFGVGTMPKKMAALFLVGAVFLFGASVAIFSDVDVSSLMQ